VTTYLVTAPYVTLKVKGDQGSTVLREFYAGAVVPDGADPGDVERLARKGYLAQQGKPEAAAAVPAGVPVPPEDQRKGRQPQASPKAG
jgi:hypothetical protein